MARIAAEIRTTITRVGVDPARILGLGVVSPGPISASTGMTLTPPVMQRWAEFPLAAALEDAVGLSVLLDNDATAAAIGEYWSGGIATGSAFAALYMGTGIGAGIIVDGTVYRGSSSNAGRGRAHLRRPRRARLLVRQRRAASRCSRDPRRSSRPPGRPVSTWPGATWRRTSGRSPAPPAGARSCPLRLLERSSRYLGVAAQTLANVLDLELVVLTGPAFALAGSLYLPEIERLLGQSFFARGSHPVRVTISSNAPEAAAVGAAALVLQSELAPRQAGLRMPLELPLEVTAGA